MRLARFLSNMKGIVVESFGEAAVSMRVSSDLPRPIPLENQVLMRVISSGVNPVDTYIRNGNYARLPSLPYTPGKDGAGIVVEVGAGVARFKKGDRVFTSVVESGSLAEFGTVDEDRVGALPDALTFPEGAALGIAYFTAYRALFQRGCAKKGETVLVHGASGGVGLAALQLAANFGLNVVGTAGTEEGLKLIKENGAKWAFNHREEGYTNKMMDSLGGRKIDLILEMLANVNLAKDLQLLNCNGRVMIIGSRGSIEINPRATMAVESSIMGVALTSASNEEWAEMYLGIEKGLKEGWIRPVVGKIYDLDHAFQAHEDVIVNQGTRGKLVVNICTD